MRRFQVGMLVLWAVVGCSSSQTGAMRAVNPDARPNNVPPTVLEAHRIAGDKLIMPDLATKAAIYAAGNPRLIGSFKLCITAGGAVASVKMLLSTGATAYDRKIEREIYDWKYRPFTVDGEPTPVCSAVAFVYSQR